MTGIPTVLVIRDPDNYTDFVVDGRVDIIEIDTGGQWDGERDMDPEDPSVIEYLAMKRAEVSQLPETSPVRQAVEEFCERIEEEEEE